jgi:signal transduction histidine kinase
MKEHNPVHKDKSDVALKLITLNFFDKGFEQQFRINYFQKSVFTLRLSLFTTIVLYAGFGLLDHLTSPNYSHEYFLIRFFIVIPVLIVSIGLTYIRVFNKIWQLLMAFAVLVAGSGIIYMLHRDPDNLYYYGGLFLIFMGSYFFLKLRFFIASLTGIVLVLIYTISFFFIPQTISSSIENLLTANAFFLASNIICMIGLYSIERLERIDFFSKKLLLEKKGEIERINSNLENKVKRRTKDLEKAKNKAEESERLKSAFLANMSHEIRTPLNGMLGFSDLLKDPELSQKERLKFLSIIEKSGGRLLSTVNDIVEISKIESGQMEMVYSTVNVLEEIQLLHDFFKPEADAKGLKFLLSVHLNETNCFISTDHLKFSSILTNLIKNAIKYTDEGYVEIICDRNDEKMVFTVRDSGIGIPPDRIAAIFNRFEQADINDKHARQGSGLGLAISKSYAEMLDGNIRVTSKESTSSSDKTSGSVFTFTLPL